MDKIADFLVAVVIMSCAIGVLSVIGLADPHEAVDMVSNITAAVSNFFSQV